MHCGFFCLWHWSFVFGLHTLCILSSLWCAFIDAWVFCSHAWTTVNSRLRLETGQLEHVSLNRTAVQSCVLSWRAPGSSAVAKNTGIGNRVLVEGSKWENPLHPPEKRQSTLNVTRLGEMGSSCNCIANQGLLSYLPLPSDLSHQRLFCPCLSKCKLLTGSLFFKMRQKTPVKPDLLCLLLSKSSELRKSHLVSVTCVVPSQRYFCVCVWIYLKHFRALCPFSQVVQIVCSSNKLPHYSLFHESLSTKALNRQRFSILIRQKYPQIIN